MKVAPQHAEGQGTGAGVQVKKGLLLGGVALEGAHVSPRDTQHTLLIEADFADPPPAGLDQAAMPAGIAAQRPIPQRLLQFPLDGQRIEQVAESAGGHRGRIISPGRMNPCSPSPCRPADAPAAWGKTRHFCSWAGSAWSGG